MTSNEQNLNGGLQNPAPRPEGENGSTPREGSFNTPETRRTDADRATEISSLLNQDPDTASDDLGSDSVAADRDDRVSGGDAGADAGPGGDGGDGDQGDQEAAGAVKPRTFKEIAEKLGMTPEEVYKMALTTGDGEEVTLGALKDAYVSQETARRETVQREVDLDARETAITQSQRLWSQLGDQLGKVLPPDAMQQLTDHLQQTDERERRTLMQMAPELQDETKLQQFRDDVVETLGQYGYKPHEVVIGDHRQALVIRDLIRAQKRLKALSEYQPEQSPPRSKRGTQPAPQSQAKIINKARRGNEADKTAAVSAILKG